MDELQKARKVIATLLRTSREVEIHGSSTSTQPTVEQRIAFRRAQMAADEFLYETYPHNTKIPMLPIHCASCNLSYNPDAYKFCPHCRRR